MTLDLIWPFWRDMIDRGQAGRLYFFRADGRQFAVIGDSLSDAQCDVRAAVCMQAGLFGGGE